MCVVLLIEISIGAKREDPDQTLGSAPADVVCALCHGKMGRYRASQMNLPNTFPIQFTLKCRNHLEFCYACDNYYTASCHKCKDGSGADPARVHWVHMHPPPPCVRVTCS